ncbi:MAG: hypothetical protein LOX97_09625 [Sphingomonas sp.]|nr:hypothetical protein [Sphingomonas sp.]
MSTSSLQFFIRAIGSAWTAERSDLVNVCRSALAKLAAAGPGEAWVAALLDERPASRELHRDQECGFVLLAHGEHEGLYRPPHDHGRAWVVYAVQSGTLEVGTYERITGPDGIIRLAKLGRTLLRAGEARAYLPGEIHDTRCLSDQALLLRFTERDLRYEDQVEGRVTRFARVGEHWVAPR